MGITTWDWEHPIVIKPGLWILVAPSRRSGKFYHDMLPEASVRLDLREPALRTVLEVPFEPAIGQVRVQMSANVIVDRPGEGDDGAPHASR